MATNLFIQIDGIKYQKSSYSAEGGNNCVGVACIDAGVFVTNTNTCDGVVRFTRKEWEAFLTGVKTGEFDIDA